MARNFAQTIEVGDTLVGDYPAPEIPGYTDRGDPDGTADVYVFYLSPLESAEETMHEGSVNSEGSEIKWDIDTSELKAGGYAWRIKGTFRRDGVTRSITFARGLLEVTKQSDPHDARLSHCRAMVAILRQVIKEKASGTGDLSAYTIGGRTTSLMSFDEVKTMLSRYEKELASLGGKKPFWEDGTRARTGLDRYLQGMR